MIHERSPLAVSAVALDLDGTMIDTAGDIADAIDATLASMGLAPLGAAVVRSLIGQGFVHLLGSALTRAADGVEPAADHLDHARRTFEQEYTASLHRRSVPYPGTLEGLDRLRSAGFPLACVTNKPARFTIPLLRALGLEGYFALLISGDTLAVKKPDPGQLLHAGDRLGVPASRLLLVGDSVHDLRAARSAGCPFFCVTYGYTPDPEELARQADAALDTLANVADHLVLAEPVSGIAQASGSKRDSDPES